MKRINEWKLKKNWYVYEMNFELNQIHCFLKWMLAISSYNEFELLSNYLHLGEAVCVDMILISFSLFLQI
jgi:hypothetical protein